ncbi:HAD family hydrolase [Lacticaseibacillus zeae]|uniref:HAD family hydrolase n=1 Tax=Lacticaseibacillus zeae TaxID=57037 RepID=A0A5R8LYR8_LACZE|nr:HAD-IA family hydrolase [Lacticaseibacillus zeae]TLF42463.1 HAD family hydrolase [Lacticaseibacillus zeae]
MTGIIFDFNGTLFADADKQEVSWRRFAERYANKQLTDQEFDDHVHGQNAELTLTYLFGRQLTKDEIVHYAELKEAIYRDLCVADVKNFHLLLGATSFLDELCAMHTPITIATASGKRNVDFFFDSFKLSQWFDLRQVVFDDGTMKSKPDPEPFLKAAAKLQCPPSKTVVFEDSSSGFTAATAAGAKHVVGIVTNDNRTRLENDDRLSLVLDDYRVLKTPVIRRLLA